MSERHRRKACKGCFGLDKSTVRRTNMTASVARTPITPTASDKRPCRRIFASATVKREEQRINNGIKKPHTGAPRGA